MKKTTIYCIFIIISYSAYAQQGFDKFTSKNPDKTYIGAIMESDNINEDTHQFLNVPTNPITVSFSVPVKSQEIAPSYDNMMNIIYKAIEEGKIPEQNSSLSHTIREIESYSNLNVFFGQTINPTLLFGTLAYQEPKQNVVAVNLEQSLFSIFMDIPDTPLLETEDVEIDKKALIYLNSVSFGRKAIVLVESKQSISKIKEAIEDIIENNNTPDKIAKSSN